MSSRWPLILLPGVGTDADLFALQCSAFPEAITPPWLPPERRESLSSYARRMAEHVAIEGPCVVGGVSLGGMIALEMTRHLDARACILISSLRKSSEMPLWARMGGPFAWLLPRRFDRWCAGAGWLMLRTLSPILPRGLKGFFTHLSKTDAPYLPWAAWAAVNWRADGQWPCPVFQIHGDADPLFPAWRLSPDRLVPRGGHVLTLTHPFIVNQFLRECLDRVQTQQ